MSGEARRTVIDRARGLDEVSRKPLVEPSIDHLVAIAEIVEMDGWNDNSPASQRAILSDIENLTAMEKRFNSSKGERRWVDWKAGRTHYGDVAVEAKIAEEGRVRESLKKKGQAGAGAHRR